MNHDYRILNDNVDAEISCYLIKFGMKLKET